MSALRIAVPRGSLLHDTLDLLDRLGLDTREVRDNDRKLLFRESGIVTMRPTDVPTYVEAGAADLGITGKDVLMEQSERDVYELLARQRRCGASGSCGSRPSTRGSPPAISWTRAARRRSSRSRARSSWHRSRVSWRRSST
jgi:hypothetical protein